jgi:hypothetical protein
VPDYYVATQVWRAGLACLVTTLLLRCGVLLSVPGCYVTTQVWRASLACLAPNVYLSSLAFLLEIPLLVFTQLLELRCSRRMASSRIFPWETPGFSRREQLRLVYVFSLVFPLH